MPRFRALLGTAATAVAAAGALCCLALPSNAYTLEELIPADHGVGVKLAIEDDDLEVLRGVLRHFIDERKVALKELCSSHTNIFHYADYNPLHYACLLDRPEHVRALVAAGCPADQETDRGFRALHAAAREGSVESLKVLLQAGADPAAVFTEKPVNNNDVPLRGFAGMSPATMAAKGGHVSVLRALLEHGGRAAESLTERDLNGEKSEAGWAPIHYAVSAGRRDAFRFLTFAVGWGVAAPRAEVVEAAHADHRREVEALGALLDGPVADLEAARARYFAENARAAAGEL